MSKSKKMAKAMKKGVLKEIFNCPNHVRVGAKDYWIIVKKIDSTNKDAHCGEVNFRKQTIMIKTGYSQQETANTVLHEMLHAIHAEYGLGDQAGEEAFTHYSSNGLCAAMVANPKIFDWIRASVEIGQPQLETI